MEVAYKLPGGKSHPFCMTSEYQFFVYGLGVSNLNTTLESISLKILRKEIQAGYFGLLQCQRLCIVEAGQIIHTLGKVQGHSKSENGYYVFSEVEQATIFPGWNRVVHPHIIWNNQSDIADAASSEWKDSEEAIAYAKEISSMMEGKVLLAKSLDTFDWR